MEAVSHPVWQWSRSVTALDGAGGAGDAPGGDGGSFNGGSDMNNRAGSGEEGGAIAAVSMTAASSETHSPLTGCAGGGR